MNRSDRTIRYPLPILLYSLCLAFAGAGGCTRTPSPEETEAPGAGAVAAAPAENPEQDARKSYANFKQKLDLAQDSDHKKLSLTKAFLQSLKQLEAKAGKPLAVTAQVEEQIKDLQKSLETKSLTVYIELEEKVLALIKEESPDFDAVNQLVQKFPIDDYKGLPVEKQVTELKARIERCQSAEMDFLTCKGKLKDDPVKNIAVLASFDPKFEDTPFWGKVQELINENYQKYSENRQSRGEESKKAASWEELAVDSFRPLWPEGDIPADAKDGILTIGPNKSDYDEKDTAGTCIRLGDDDWIDVDLHFEAQVKAVEKIYFGVRGHQGADDVFSFQWENLKDLGIADDKWHELVVRLSGPAFEIIDATGKKSARKDNLRVEEGAFGIRVTGDSAVIKIRKLQVAVKNRGSSAADGDAKDEGKKGKDAAKKGKKAGAKEKAKNEPKDEPADEPKDEPKGGGGTSEAKP